MSNSRCSRSHLRQLDLEQSFFDVFWCPELPRASPGRSWRVLGGPGGPWEDLGESFGGSWGIHGRSWRVLGGSRRTLGRILGDSWGLLVRTWGVPGGSWRFLQRVLERSRGDPRGFFRVLGNAEYTYLCGICEVFSMPRAGLLFHVFCCPVTFRIFLDAF